MKKSLVFKAGSVKYSQALNIICIFFQATSTYNDTVTQGSFRRRGFENDHQKKIYISIKTGLRVQT